MKNEQPVDFWKRETVKLEDAQAGLQSRRCRHGAAVSQQRVSEERSDRSGQHPGHGTAADQPRDVPSQRVTASLGLQLREHPLGEGEGKMTSVNEMLLLFTITFLSQQLQHL